METFRGQHITQKPRLYKIWLESKVKRYTWKIYFYLQTVNILFILPGVFNLRSNFRVVGDREFVTEQTNFVFVFDCWEVVN